MTLEDFMANRLLTWMKEHGSSVAVAWEKDGNVGDEWGCCWFSDGESYRGYGVNVTTAIIDTLNKAGQFERAVRELHELT